MAGRIEATFESIQIGTRARPNKSHLHNRTTYTTLQRRLIYGIKSSLHAGGCGLKVGVVKSPVLGQARRHYHFHLPNPAHTKKTISLQEHNISPHLLITRFINVYILTSISGAMAPMSPTPPPPRPPICCIMACRLESWS